MTRAYSSTYFLLFNFYQYDVDRRIFWFILVHVIYLENIRDIFLSQRYKFISNTDCSVLNEKT